jgi:ATP-dependent protease ClpP protease subunit
MGTETKQLAWRILAEDIPTIEIFDTLGDYGLTVKEFKKTLKGIRGKSLHLVVDSQGGDPNVGISLYSLLQEWADAGRHLEAHVAMAASAASVIPLAANKITIAPTGRYFIHEPYALGVTGNTDELRKVAKTTDTLATLLVGIYSLRTGASPEVWRERMRDEVWYVGAEAVEVGLADAVATPAWQVAASARQKETRLAVPAAILAGVHIAQIEKALQRSIASGIRNGLVAAWGVPPAKPPHRWSYAGGGLYPRH